MKTKIIASLIVVLVLLASGYMVYQNLDIAKENTLNNLTGIQSSDAVVKEFIKDKQSSSAKYIHKKINIKGKVKVISEGYVVLENNVICHMENDTKALLTGDEVVIKGEVDSYDDLMEEIKLEHCLVVN